MTNPDRCREEFENFCKKILLSTSKIGDEGYLFAETAAASEAWQAAQQATARRCVELCHYVYEHSPDDRKPAVMECLVTITTEFGLQGE